VERAPRCRPAHIGRPSRRASASSGAEGVSATVRDVVLPMHGPRTMNGIRASELSPLCTATVARTRPTYQPRVEHVRDPRRPSPPRRSPTPPQTAPARSSGCPPTGSRCQHLPRPRALTAGRAGPCRRRPVRTQPDVLCPTSTTRLATFVASEMHPQRAIASRGVGPSEYAWIATRTRPMILHVGSARPNRP
jgi:hypothetical protein